MELHDRIILEHDEYRDRIIGFLNDLKRDDFQIKTFINNPSGYIEHHFFKPEELYQLKPQVHSEANEFLFKLLANDRFRNWLAHYQKGVIEKFKNEGKFDKEQVFYDFIEAYQQFGDKDIIRKAVLTNIDKDADPLKINYWGVVHVAYVALAVLFIIIIDIPIIIRPNPDITSADFRVIAEALINKSKKEAFNDKTRRENG